MKKVFILMCLLFGCISVSAQNDKAIYVVVVDESGKEVDTYMHAIIVDLFQETLIEDGYDVRLTRNKDVYSMQKLLELEYQERGAVSMDEAIEGGSEIVVGTYCVIQMRREVSGVGGSKEYYFNAKIYDLRTGNLKKHANYPNLDIDENKKIREIDRMALQIVSLHLLKGLGFDIDDDKLANVEAKYFNIKTEVDKNTKKEERRKELKNNVNKIKKDVRYSYDKIFKPENNSFEMRVLSSFDIKGIVGLGFYFSKSYFKIGADVIFAKGFLSGSELEQDDMNNLDSDYNQDDIANNFILLSTTEKILDNGAVTLCDEYASPKAQFFITPGVAFKYFSIECGLGVVLCKSLNVEYARYNYSQSSMTGTLINNKSYFAFRPTVTGYIPIVNGPKISISAGYNCVSQSSLLGGFVFGVGIGF